jgi:thioesterase domain-containing protein
VAPRTETEALICRLVAEVTGASQVGAEDSFFELGGHSLSAMRLLAALRQATGREIALRSLFEQPTAAGLALALDLPAGYSPLLPLRVSGSEAPLFAIHGGEGLGLVLLPLARSLPDSIPLYALTARGVLGPEPFFASLDEMADAYTAAIRSVQPAGPYRLLGYSFGAAVAHAVALRLEQAGEAVQILISVDGPVPGARDQSCPSEALPTARDELEALDPAERDLQVDAILPAALAGADGEDPDDLLRRITTAPRTTRRVGQHMLLVGLMRRRQAPPPKCRAPVLLIRATERSAALEDMAEALEKAVFDWTRATSGGVSVIAVAASHWTIMKRPHLAGYAGAIVDALRGPRCSPWSGWR